MIQKNINAHWIPKSEMNSQNHRDQIISQHVAIYSLTHAMLPSSFSLIHSDIKAETIGKMNAITKAIQKVIAKIAINESWHHNKI